MDKSESRGDLVKSQLVPCSRSRGATERQKLEDEINSLLKVIREKESCLKEKLIVSETNQKRLKDIRQEKDATINKRRAIDEELNALNNEKKRETFLKLRGSLQYRTEIALNEAIRRLEQQLVKYNYKVTEEIKIVQEIDRLKRLKKPLKDYLDLEKELDKMKEMKRIMRTQRDTLYRHVTTLKADEDDAIKKLAGSRGEIDLLRKELDSVHGQKRKLQGELKQTCCKELHQKRQHSFKKKEHGCPVQKCSPREEFWTQDCSSFCRKERNENRCEERKQWDNITICSTLIRYLQRLVVSSVVPPPALPSPEPVVSRPAEEIQFGDKVLVLKKRDDDEVFAGLKCMRTIKKVKEKKKRTQNRLLSHAPETLDQFFKLEVTPPTCLNDVPSCLEALETKKKQLMSPNDGDVTSPLDHSKEGDCSTLIATVSNCTDGNASREVEVEVSVDSRSSVDNALKVEECNCDMNIPKEDLSTVESTVSNGLSNNDVRVVSDLSSSPSSAPLSHGKTSLPESSVDVSDLPSSSATVVVELPCDGIPNGGGGGKWNINDVDLKKNDVGHEGNASYLNDAISNGAFDSEGDSGDGFVLLPMNPKLLLLDDVVHSDSGYLANNMCCLELSCPHLVSTLRLDGNLKSMHDNRSTL